MASSTPNFEDELKTALETLISFDAFTEKAGLDAEKYHELEQSMKTYISLTNEMMDKARDGHNNCREYLIARHPSLLRPTPGRKDEDEDNSSCRDSGISSGFIAEECGNAEKKEHSSLTLFPEQSDA
ncbi:hypothetical protein CHS0354_043127 [Potamilus streckersoni]|uniref:Uncharacterized protein n=1 Tax=Potamilus streckersoni TaxID=2493646 RepID=A0AAE0VSG3_9BIVA|nr:hypothetical protein CHS0354_043127 [Potamilus streckersoni]